MHSSLPGCSKPVLPTLRVTPAVETRDYHDFVLADRVDDAVWEAAQYRSPRFAMHHRVEQRIASNGFDAGIQDAQELDGESLTTRLVPLGCLVDLEIRLRAEDQPSRHPNRWCSRQRASSQGSADSGSRSCSARRRSISARCVSVSGNASGLAAILSQRSSANWMRSGTLNLSNSSWGTCIICQDYRSTTIASTIRVSSETSRGIAGGGQTKAPGGKPGRMVLMHTRFGGARMIDMLVGDPLPRVYQYVAQVM
jgi:hypothetical protein